MNIFRKFDLFGAQVPQFNLNGQKDVRSLIGGIASFLVISTTFLFATLKLQHLLQRKNPTVSIYSEEIAD